MEHLEQNVAQLSVVIPTCNRRNTLEICLRALQASVVASGDVEVCVLDDGSTEDSRQLVEKEFPWAIWIRGPRRGPAANRNAGAKASTGKWLVFVDDDCVPRTGHLEAYRRAISGANGSRWAFEGPTFAPGVQTSLLWEAPHNPSGGLLISCNFAISREYYLELGGFDERYPVAAFEDTEFAVRIERTGGTVCFVPAAAVDHPWRNLPSAQRLAQRWEARVIYALDQGAKPFQIAWRLPWHVFCVRINFLRKGAISRANLFAACVFIWEWLLVVALTPRWISKWCEQPRSSFWVREVEEAGAVNNYGF